MSTPTPTISVPVDVTNPGQFFACCGLFELADRLWPGAEGWFTDGLFQLVCDQADLAVLTDACVSAALHQVDRDDAAASPIHLGRPFDLQLDWWLDEWSGGRALKVWAGSMHGPRIATAMQAATAAAFASPTGPMDAGMVVYDPEQPAKKVEPFYFDSRRGAAALPLDIGFSPNAHRFTTLAFPAVEFLCLIGLQRFRPAATDRRRVFDYTVWNDPLPVATAPLAVAGVLPKPAGSTYRFEVAFRTDQKKHKCFHPATPIGDLQ